MKKFKLHITSTDTAVDADTFQSLYKKLVKHLEQEEPYAALQVENLKLKSIIEDTDSIYTKPDRLLRVVFVKLTAHYPKEYQLYQLVKDEYAPYEELQAQHKQSLVQKNIALLDGLIDGEGAKGKLAKLLGVSRSHIYFLAENPAVMKYTVAKKLALLGLNPDDLFDPEDLPMNEEDFFSITLQKEV